MTWWDSVRKWFDGKKKSKFPTPGPKTPDKKTEYNGAADWIAKRSNLTTAMGSREIAETWTAKARAQSFFSARVSEDHILKELRKVSDAFSRGEIGQAEARTNLKRFLIAEGKDDGTNGLRNLASTARLNLVLTQNARMAAAVGQYQAGMDPDIKKRFPCWRYVRSTAADPRDSHAQYAGKVYSKDDPIWRKIFPPSDFNCKCSVEECDDEPDTAPQNIETADSGFEFDPAHAFEQFDTDQIEDPELRARTEEGLREILKKKLTPEEHKAYRQEQLVRAKENRLKREAKLLNANLISEKHTAEDDLSMVNPNFRQGNEFRINCQRSVTAYEARRRGIDVEALPCYGNDGFGIMMLSDGSLNPNGWSSAYKNPKAVYCGAKNGSGTEEKATDQMKQWGEGSRAIVRVQWQGGRTGHVFIAENVNGKIRYIDPQTNDMNVCSYFNSVKKNQTYIIRVDNLKFGNNVKKCCKKRGL